MLVYVTDTSMHTQESKLSALLSVAKRAAVMVQKEMEMIIDSETLKPHKVEDLPPEAAKDVLLLKLFLDDINAAINGD